MAALEACSPASSSPLGFYPRFDAWQSPKWIPRINRGIDAKSQFPLPLTWPTAESRVVDLGEDGGVAGAEAREDGGARGIQ